MSDEKNTLVHQMVAMCIAGITLVARVKSYHNVPDAYIIWCLQCLLLSGIMGTISFIISNVIGNTQKAQIMKGVIILILATIVMGDDM